MDVDKFWEHEKVSRLREEIREEIHRCGESNWLEKMREESMFELYTNI